MVKRKKKSEKSKNNSHSEGDVKDVMTCNNCHFRSNVVGNNAGYCKRHREKIKTLFLKHVLDENHQYCILWHADLR